MEIQKLMNESSVDCEDGMCRLGAQRQPSADTVQSFSDAYEKGDQRSGEQESQREKGGDKQEAQVLPSPTSLMESLFSGRMQVPDAAAVQESAPVATVSKTVDTLLERILVAEPTRGAQEVRLTLGDGMLKGAELSIMRYADGQLTVRVSCVDVSSFQTAVSARQSLVDALEARGERVRIVVDQGDARGGNEGDSRQRSQGLQTMAEEPENA